MSEKIDQKEIDDWNKRLEGEGFPAEPPSESEIAAKEGIIVGSLEEQAKK